MPGNDAPLNTKSTNTTTILVFLICRVRLYQQAILGLLNRQAGINAVGSVDTFHDLILALDAVEPDAVLLDTGSPEALVLATRVVKARPSTRILGFGVDDVPPQVIACAQAGLWGYLPSNASTVELARAARRVAFGETVWSVGMGEKLFHHLRSVALRDSGSKIDTVLTVRQQQILKLINEGLSNKQIAQRLSLGTSTVKNHVHGLLSRLQVGRRSEAAGHMDRAAGAARSAAERIPNHEFADTDTLPTSLPTPVTSN
jgi:two-component system, NarL family, nitrate/nitrite response regulator NarL